jgi:hypothetical protein
MEIEQAEQLAKAYTTIPGHTGGDGAVVTSVLRALLPSNSDAACAAVVRGRPAVLTLDGQSVLVVRLRAGRAAGSIAEVGVRQYYLDPNQVRLNVMMDVRGQGAAYGRDWTFVWPGNRPTLALRGDLDAEQVPDSVERFAQALAGKLGWTIPTA